jgi:hypothetical protein
MEKKGRKTDISFLLGKGAIDEPTTPVVIRVAETQRHPQSAGRPLWFPSMGASAGTTFGIAPDFLKKPFLTTPIGWSSFDFSPATPFPSAGNGSSSVGMIESQSTSAFSSRSTPMSSFPMEKNVVHQSRPMNLQSALYTPPETTTTATVASRFPAFLQTSTSKLMSPTATSVMMGTPSYAVSSSVAKESIEIGPFFRQHAVASINVPGSNNSKAVCPDLSWSIPFQKLDPMQGKLLSVAHPTSVSPTGFRLPFERPPKGGHLLGWKRDREEEHPRKKMRRKSKKVSKKTNGKPSSSLIVAASERSYDEKPGLLIGGGDIDPALCHKQSVLIKLFGLPDNFRYRDARKWLFNKCDDRQRDFLEASPLCNGVNQILLKTLPHRLTVQYFATCILLLAFHISALTGKVPSFWSYVKDNKEIIDCIDEDVMHMFKPAIGICVRSRRAQLLVKGDGTKEEEEAGPFETTLLRCSSDYHKRLNMMGLEEKSGVVHKSDEGAD